MTEEERIRQALADAVEDEPPLGLDIDRVVTRGRRAARLRTLLGAASMTACVAALATALPLLVPAGGPGGPPPALPAGTPSGPAPTAGVTAPDADAGTQAEYLRSERTLHSRAQELLTLVFPDSAPSALSANSLGFVSGGKTQEWKFTRALTTEDGRITVTVTVRVAASPLPGLPCPGTADSGSDSPAFLRCEVLPPESPAPPATDAPTPDGSPTRDGTASTARHTVTKDGTAQRVERLSGPHHLVTVTATLPASREQLPPETLDRVARALLSPDGSAPTGPPDATAGATQEEKQT